jgi:hypothetical protein
LEIMLKKIIPKKLFQNETKCRGCHRDVRQKDRRTVLIPATGTGQDDGNVSDIHHGTSRILLDLNFMFSIIRRHDGSFLRTNINFDINVTAHLQYQI